MSHWITITAAHLEDTKVAALVTALRTAALGASQADPVSEIISTITARIRAEIAGCARNQLDATETTIPADLKRLACRMIVFEMMGRLRLALNDDERDQMRNDLRYLERIAKCEVPVAKPDSAAAPEVQQSGGIQQVGTTRRIATRETLRGL